MISVKRNLYLGCMLLLSAVMPIKTSAQSQSLFSNKLDTLSFGERFSLKTNAVDWLMLTPNIGIEYDLINKNWSKWTIGVSGRYNWDTKPEKLSYNVYNLKELRADIRRYRRLHKIRSYYLGLFGSYDDYDVKLSHTGRTGKAFIFGPTAGILKSLYTYKNGSHVDLEVGLSVGAMYTKNKKFTLDKEANSYVYQEEKDWHFVKYPVVSEARLGFLYRFGPEVRNHHRRRVEVDDAYREKINERKLAKQREERERELRKDSIAAAREAAKIEKAAAKEAAKEAKAAEKEAKIAEKQAKEAEKQAAKEAKAIEKANKKAEKEALKAESAASKAESEVLKETTKADKAAIKEAKAAEKAATKAEKASRKAAAKAEKEAEKEAKKAIKAAAKAKKQATD